MRRTSRTTSRSTRRMDCTPNRHPSAASIPSPSRGLLSHAGRQPHRFSRLRGRVPGADAPEDCWRWASRDAIVGKAVAILWPIAHWAVAAVGDQAFSTSFATERLEERHDIGGDFGPIGARIGDDRSMTAFVARQSRSRAQPRRGRRSFERLREAEGSASANAAAGRPGPPRRRHCGYATTIIAAASTIVARITVRLAVGGDRGGRSRRGQRRRPHSRHARRRAPPASTREPPVPFRRVAGSRGGRALSRSRASTSGVRK